MEEKPLVLCDTNVIIDFYKEDAGILKELHTIGQERIAVSIITAGYCPFTHITPRSGHWRMLY